MSTLTYSANNAHGQEREFFSAVQEATQQGALVGYSVMWFMDGLSSSNATLRSLMADPEIALGDFVPDPPSPRVALHRALEAMLRDLKGLPALDETSETDVSDARKLLIRPINDYDKEWMVFAIVGEAADFMNSALRYKTEWRVKFHKKTGAMVCVTTPSGAISQEQDAPELTQQLTPYWLHYKEHHTSRDISVVVKSVIDWASAISLRKGGGVYFVPVEHENTLDRVRLLIERLVQLYGGEPVFLTLGVPDKKETMRQMSIAAHIALMDEADALIANVNKVLNGDAKTRERTRTDRLGQWHLFHAKLESYDFILADRREQMEARLTQLNELVERLVAED